MSVTKKGFGQYFVTGKNLEMLPYQMMAELLHRAILQVVDIPHLVQVTLRDSMSRCMHEPRAENARNDGKPQPEPAQHEQGHGTGSLPSTVSLDFEPPIRD